MEGEKEFITLREIHSTPPELLDAAKEFWEVTGDVLNRLLGEIASSLGMRKDLLTRYSEPCSKLQEKRTATMIRLFRYEGDGVSRKVVSERRSSIDHLEEHGNTNLISTSRPWPLELVY